MIGRRYHRVYGYPWRWAIPAEIAWRIEHLFSLGERDDMPLIRGRVTRAGYRWRKQFERRGAAS